MAPSESAKLLGVVLDSGLTFKEYVARAAKRGWQPVKALPRLRGIRPATARQIYTATVASRIDYAAAVWYSRYLGRGMPQWMRQLLTPVDRFAAKVIINCFRTGSGEVACAEAGIHTTPLRLTRRIASFWIDIHTLPRTNLMWASLHEAAVATSRTQFTSPAMHMARTISRILNDLETIEAFAVAPWHQSTARMVDITIDREEAVAKCVNAQGSELQMFTDGSKRMGMVGYSVVVWTDGIAQNQVQRTIGTKDRVSIYTVELGAIVEAVESATVMLDMPTGMRSATVYSDSRVALQAITNP